MKNDLNNTINGLLLYLELNSIDELRSLPINNDLINKVSNFLFESNEKITTSKVADLLSINRASIYNTYPQSAQYLQALIIQQKAFNNPKKLSKKNSPIKNTTEKAHKLNNLNKEKIEKFMTIIMSLEFQNKQKDKKIHMLNSKIASLESTIRDLKTSTD